MPLGTRLLSILAPATTLALCLWSATAHATSVECTNELGTCEVSNDNGDSFSCACAGGGSDGGVGGGTGGEDGGEWEGLSEEELLEICNDMLSFCDEGEPDADGVDDVGTDDGFDDDSDGTDDENNDGVDGSAEGDDGNSDDGLGTDGGEGDGGGDDGVSGDGGDGGDAGGDDGAGGDDAADDDQEAGGSDDGGVAENQKGCSLAQHGNTGATALLLLGLVGATALRRREA